MPYRYAIIGCGQIGRRHASLAAGMGQLVALCDTDPAKLSDLTLQYGVPGYGQMDELVAAEKPDIVVICTPNGLHAGQTIDALRAGCHVLCEKPMAIFGTDARLMVNAAKEAGKRLFVVKQNRFNPPVTYIKGLLDEGALGDIHGFQLNCFWNRSISYFASSTWRGSLDLDGGPLYTQFSHFIDLLIWFLGKPGRILHASGNNYSHPDILFEDEGQVVLEMENGATGTIQYSLNAWRENMEGSLALFGNRGTVRIGGTYLNELTHFAVEGLAFPELPLAAAANDYGSYQGSMSNHNLVYKAMIDSLQDDSYKYMDPAEGILSVELIEDIYNIMRQPGGNING